MIGYQTGHGTGYRCGNGYIWCGGVVKLLYYDIEKMVHGYMILADAYDIKIYPYICGFCRIDLPLFPTWSFLTLTSSSHFITSR